MFKKIMMWGVGLVFLSVTVGAFAEDVYMSKRGKKYHQETCPFMENVIKNNKAQKLSKEEAMAQGRVACSRCFPDEVSAKTKKINQQKSSDSAQKAAR